MMITDRVLGISGRRVTYDDLGIPVFCMKFKCGQSPGEGGCGLVGGGRAIN